MWNGTETDIEIPSRLNGHEVTVVSSHAFRNVDLVSVKLPEGCVRIEECAFMDCSKLATVIVPETVTTIDEKAFHNCNMDLVFDTDESTYAASYAKSHQIRIWE